MENKINMPIIDIHSHIIYGVDDGAIDLDMSLELIDDLYNQGIHDIICTTHSYCIEDNREKYDNRFNEINDIIKVKYPDLHIYKGCEILCYKSNMSEIIRKIESGIYPTLNNSKYVLIEFDIYTKDMVDIFEIAYCSRKLLDHGYVPIIAHAERYYDVYDNIIEDVKALKRMGCMIQVNLYSIIDDAHLYNKTANVLFNNKLIDFVGTDTHRTSFKNIISVVEKMIKENGKIYAYNILFANANRCLLNEI